MLGGGVQLFGAVLGKTLSFSGVGGFDPLRPAAPHGLGGVLPAARPCERVARPFHREGRLRGAPLASTVSVVSFAFTPSHRGGSGPPLVCLHGFTDTWRTWELVLPALERRYDVLAPTLPGHAGGPPLDGDARRRRARRRGRAGDGRGRLRDGARRRQLARRLRRAAARGARARPVGRGARAGGRLGARATSRTASCSASSVGDAGARAGGRAATSTRSSPTPEGRRQATRA